MSLQLNTLYTAVCESTLHLVERVRHRRNYQKGTSGRSRNERYGVALLVVVLTLLLRYLLGKWFDVQAVYILFVIPVILAALYGGMFAGVIATLVGGLLATAFFIIGGLGDLLHNWPALSSLILFVIEGLLISLLIETVLYLLQKLEERAQILQESEERFRLLLEGVKDYAICMLDTHGHIVSWNRAAERLQGYSAQEIIGKHFSVFSAKPTTYDKHNTNLAMALKEGRYEEEGWRKRKDGTEFWANIVITPLKDDRGKVQGFAKITRDITERKQFEDSIKYQAMHDPLTGLPNRSSLEDRLNTALVHARRNKSQLGILFLDLDRFKSINDTLGHHVGDRFLAQVGTRLKEAIREEDTVARFGGDEFVILLPEVRHPRDAVQVAKKLIDSLRPSFSITNHEVHINASIGISIFPQDGQDVPTLLKNADVALYQAKDAGKDMYKLYTRTMNVRASERMSLENSLRQAIQKSEFSVVYQPVMHLAKGEISGAEALIRWVHPKLGPIFPNDFIPLAEETGLIIPIDEWVISEVCRSIKVWNEKGLPRIKVAINLSARQFSQPNLFETIQRLTREHGIDTEQIEFEITESMVMENIGVATEKLSLLKSIGLQSAIDDFGMGFSSLNILKNLPIDKLKIDKTFVKHATTDPRDAAIVKAIITMAHTLKMQVVAEGIEAKEHLEFLRSLHCDYGQGYFVSAPLSPQAFEDLLRKKKPLSRLAVSAK